MGRATGFFLYAGDRLVTNEHVINGADYVIVDTYWRRRLRIDKVLARDRRLDLAILPVPNSFRPDVLQLSDETLSEGQTVFVIGSPKATAFGISQGVIVQTGYLRGESRQVIQADISSGPGSSGSPLLDRKGRVVGVLYGGNPEDRQFSFAIHGQELWRLAASASEAKNMGSSYPTASPQAPPGEWVTFADPDQLAN